MKPVILSREGGIIFLWQKRIVYENKTLFQNVSKLNLKVVKYLIQRMDVIISELLTKTEKSHRQN